MNNITRSGSLQLRKATGGKYVRREATGDPKKPWRYYYTGPSSPSARRKGLGIKEPEKKEGMPKEAYDKKHDVITDKYLATVDAARKKASDAHKKHKAGKISSTELRAANSAYKETEEKANQQRGQAIDKLDKEHGKSQSDSDINKAVTPLETIKYAQQVVNEAEQVKTAEGRLYESIEHTVGYTWHGCLERVFTTGEMPPEGNYPYPRGFYDAGSRGANGSIGDFSEEELLYKTLDLTAIKVYVDIMRRGNTHDKDLLEGMKKVKFNPEYVKKVILSSDEVLEEIRRGIKGHIGRLLAGEGSSRAGYMMSEQDNDLQKSGLTITTSGSAQLRRTR